MIRVNTPEQYFVYTHSIDGIVFYVGFGGVRPPKKGCHSHGVKYERAYTKSKRTEHWKTFVNGRDFEVSIIAHFETEEQAFRLETELIQKHGTISNGGSLINVMQDNAVYQFDLLGNLVKKHLSATIASKETGINEHSIRSMCLGYGIRRAAGGFMWSYLEKCTSFFEGREQLLMKTLDGSPVKRFDTISSAAKEMGTSSITSIRKVLSGKQKKAYGHTWEMVPHELEINDGEARKRGFKKSRLGKVNKG